MIHPDAAPARVSLEYRNFVEQRLKENWVSGWGIFHHGQFAVHRRGYRVDRAAGYELFSSILTEFDDKTHLVFTTSGEGWLQVGEREGVIEDAQRKRARLSSPQLTIDPGNIRFVERSDRYAYVGEESGATYFNEYSLPESHMTKKRADELMARTLAGESVSGMERCPLLVLPDEYKGKEVEVVTFSGGVDGCEDVYVDAVAIDKETGKLIPRKIANAEKLIQRIQEHRPDRQVRSNILGNINLGPATA